MAARPPGAVLAHAGDLELLVDRDLDLGAVGFADVRLVDAVAVGLDAQRGAVDLGEGGRLDLLGGRARQGILAGAAGGPL
jgi:hypothetical protein